MHVKVMRRRADVCHLQSEMLKEIRNALEASPVSVSEGVFQCDERSMTRMRDVARHWGCTVESMTPDGRQKWPDVQNNELLFTQEQFVDFVGRIERARIVRADKLRSVYVGLRALLPLPDGHEAFTSAGQSWASVM